LAKLQAHERAVQACEHSEERDQRQQAQDQSGRMKRFDVDAQHGQALGERRPEREVRDAVVELAARIEASWAEGVWRDPRGIGART
jgi:hypothetical protein